MPRTDEPHPVPAYDVVVIGGGPAGLSGALALGRARRSVLVIDAGQPRNAPATHAHNYLGREGVAPGELLATGRREIEGYGATVRRGTATSAVALADPAPGASRFRVRLDDGDVVDARRLLVTTGLVDELPDVPGLAERWGRDVLHCPYCHGWEVRDQPIGILGTSPMAAHQALLFRQWSADVVLFTHTGPPPTPEQREQLDARGIRVVDGEVTEVVTTDDALTGLRLASGEVVPRVALVVAPFFAARPGVLDDLGLELTDMTMGDLVVGRSYPSDPMGATSVPGVYLAGNVTDLRAQVVTSAAAGLWAGASVNSDLIMEDTALAVAAYRENGVAA